MTLLAFAAEHRPVAPLLLSTGRAAINRHLPAARPTAGGLKTRDHEKYGGGKRRTGKRGTKSRGGKGRTGKHGTKSQGWKSQDWKTRDQIAGVEKAELENAGPNFQGGKRTTTVY